MLEEAEARIRFFEVKVDGLTEVVHSQQKELESALQAACQAYAAERIELTQDKKEELSQHGEHGAPESFADKVQEAVEDFMGGIYAQMRHLREHLESLVFQIHEASREQEECEVFLSELSSDEVRESCELTLQQKAAAEQAVEQLTHGFQKVTDQLNGWSQQYEKVASWVPEIAAVTEAVAGLIQAESFRPPVTGRAEPRLRSSVS
jgi:hypothetical protein